MVKFIGQTKLVDTFSKYTLAQLPKTFMLIGAEGCGKHTLAKYVADKFNLVFTEISQDIEQDTLVEYNLSVFNTLYFIDLDKFYEKQQNKLLKFIEEPPSTATVCIAASAEANVLPTILNRCIKYTFAPYTEVELRQVKFINSDIAYKVCLTPGQLIEADYMQLQAIYDCCKYLIANLNNLTYTKLLSISFKINYNEEYDKFNFNTFCNTLKLVALENYKQTGTGYSLNIYRTINSYLQLLPTANFVKESFILNLFNKLYEVFA